MPYYIVPEGLEGDLPQVLHGEFEASPTKFLKDPEVEPSKGLFSLFRRKAAQSPVSPGTRRIIDLLRAAGIRRVEFDYDGGNDEGFAEFGSARTASEDLSLEELARRLTISELIDPWLEGMQGDAATIENFRKSRIGRLSKLSPAEQVRDILFDLGEEAGVLLLGEGWGTGEYIMTGRISIDLETGAVEDMVLDPPPNMRQQFIDNFGEYRGEDA